VQDVQTIVPHLLDHTAGNLFEARGVAVGDAVYAVTILSGHLYVCGRMTVGELCDARNAARWLGLMEDEIWEAREHLLASEATPMRFDLCVPVMITTRLRFVADKREKGLKFVVPGALDSQTLRGVREMTKESACLLLDELDAAHDLTGD